MGGTETKDRRGGGARSPCPVHPRMVLTPTLCKEGLQPERGPPAARRQPSLRRSRLLLSQRIRAAEDLEKRALKLGLRPHRGGHRLGGGGEGSQGGEAGGLAASGRHERGE